MATIPVNILRPFSRIILSRCVRQQLACKKLPKATNTDAEPRALQSH